MRKLFAALFAVAIAVMLFVVVARSISSSPVEPSAPCALEIECPAPGVAEAERVTCVTCSESCIHCARFVEMEIAEGHATRVTMKHTRLLANDYIHGMCQHRAATSSTDGYPLKLPLVAVVNAEIERNANSVAHVEVEVLVVGV